MKLLLLLLISVLIFLSMSAEGVPEKAINCNYCHNMMNVDVYKDGDECGYCHEVLSNSLLHESKTCSVCHGVYDTDTYHQIHHMECTVCHGNSGEQVPSTPFISCTGCHGDGKIHKIHTQCNDCHGNTIKDKEVWDTDKEKKDYSNLTIYSMLINLYKIIIGG